MTSPIVLSAESPEPDVFTQLLACIEAEVLPGYREGAMPGSRAALEGILFDLTGLFIATELGGEVGEALNVVKKLVRERLGWGGSRSTVDRLAEELGDVIIVSFALAQHYQIDLPAAVAAKFNDAQDRWGRALKIKTPAALTPINGETNGRSA